MTNSSLSQRENEKTINQEIYSKEKDKDWL